MVVAVLDFIGAGLLLFGGLAVGAASGQFDPDVRQVILPIVAVLLLLGVLYLVLGVFLLKGQGWARVVQVILAGLSFVGGIMSLSQGRATAGVLLSLAVAVAMVVLLFTKDAQEYFDGRRRGGRPSRRRV